MANFIGSRQMYDRDIWARQRDIKTSDQSVTVATASTLLLRANAMRKWVAIINKGANYVTLGLGYTPTTGTGIYLGPSGGSYMIDDLNPFFGEIRAIADTGSSVVHVVEGYYG